MALVRVVEPSRSELRIDMLSYARTTVRGCDAHTVRFRDCHSGIVEVAEI